jgi:hypothetical protein
VTRATTKDKAAQSEKDEQDTSAKPAGEQVRSDEQADNEVKAGETREVETDAHAAASGTTAGAVKRGDTGLGEDDDTDLNFDADTDAVYAASGYTREGKVDVPWMALVPDHFPEEYRHEDPEADWTVQTREDPDDEDSASVALVPAVSEPGQTFHPAELPNVDVLKEAGIDPVTYLAGLPVKAAPVADDAAKGGAFG